MTRSALRTAYAVGWLVLVVGIVGGCQGPRLAGPDTDVVRGGPGIDTCSGENAICELP